MSFIVISQQPTRVIAQDMNHDGILAPKEEVNYVKGQKPKK